MKLIHRKSMRYLVRYFVMGKWATVNRGYQHLSAARRTAEKLIGNALIGVVEIILAGRACWRYQ